MSIQAIIVPFVGIIWELSLNFVQIVENLLILKLEKKIFKLKFKIYRTTNRGNSLMERSKKWWKIKAYVFSGFFLGVFNWILLNLGAPVISYITSLWIILLYTFSWWILGHFCKFKSIRLSGKEKYFLENLLKKKGLEFFQRGLLISIFLSSMFRFYFEQFSAVFGLVFNIIIWTGLERMEKDFKN